MMVPRAFSRPSISSSPPRDLDEKGFIRRGSTRSDQTARPRKPSQPQLTPLPASEPSRNAASTPVQIPSHRSKRPTPGPVQLAATAPQTAPPTRLEPRRREFVQDLLSATAIPVRRRPKGRAIQRLPDINHVEHFSELLLADVTTKGDGVTLSSSLGNPQFDGLFGNIDELVEGQMFVGSEGLDAGIFSPRSVSSESMPSLASPDDFASSDLGSLSFRKSPSDRRLRQLASSEDCASNHPLLHSTDESTSSNTSLPDLANPSITRLKRRQVVPKSAPGSFKSTLSASLRALKAAAQTVSNIATTPPTIQPDDFLTRSVFSIQPALTDDKRPPPSNEPPSPALRRYLNPLPPNTPPDSPTHLHFWHDDRPLPNAAQTQKPKVKRKSRKGDPLTSAPSHPPVVPLQSCIPPAIRTAHASSPPIWLSPDGTPSNKNTAHNSVPLLALEPGMPRQREPRENRDFLRVLVAEMNMQRAGKLEEGKNGELKGAGKAVLWLPPVKEEAGRSKKVGIDRLVSFSVNDVS